MSTYFIIKDYGLETEMDHASGLSGTAIDLLPFDIDSMGRWGAR